jgi:hypothetical protein
MLRRAGIGAMGLVRSAVALGVSVGAMLVVVSVSLGAEQVASQSRVTIFARPTVIDWAESARLYGAAPGASHDDVVTIQVRECGSSFFRSFVELHPSAGGGWSTPAGSAITATYRASWRGRTSSAVTIRQRVGVGLEQRRSGNGFVVAVSGKRSFWRKQVVIQRRQGRRWETVRRVVLSDSVSSTGTVSVSQATFRLAVPTGTLLRALLPEEQARPCYVASTSKVVRT